MDAESYYLKGLVEYENNCYEAAIGYFEQSIEIEEHFKSYERLYSCWQQLGDTKKAFDCIEKAYRLNPDSDKTAFEFATMLAESEKYEQAREVLAGILQRNPTYKKAAVLADSLKKSN